MKTKKSDRELSTVRNALKRLRTMKHPYLLRCIDAGEVNNEKGTGTIYLVTEPVWTDSSPQAAVHRQMSTDRCPQTEVHRQKSTDSSPQTAVHRQMSTEVEWQSSHPIPCHSS